MEPKSTTSKSGFTLIEIMIVILILGIIMAIAIPNMLTARSNSSARVCRENLRAISHAKERWAMENNKPASATPVWSDIVPTYLKGQMPVCPENGTYSIGDLGTDPTCSKGGEHSIQ